jgi:hypothetical protein
MQETPELGALSRRQLLKRTVATGAVALLGPGFIAAPNAAWALEVNHISPHVMATLLQMARDIYPHDRIADEYYAIAVKGYDSAEQQAMVNAGVEKLDSLAQTTGAPNYMETKWEANRVDLLQQIEDDEFFQTIRGGLVTGLYNQKAVWPLFGYEGESASKGGYINRGFNDINWL